MADEDRDGAEKAGKMRVAMAPNPLPADEIYIDGISGVLHRPGLVKLDCYRVARVDGANNTEVRTITHRLVLPTSAIRELARVLQGVKGRRGAGSDEGEQAPPEAETD